jgi:import inner membrane translocase subunit TIM23
MFYSAGTCYIAGFVGGCAWGAFEGSRVASREGLTGKLKWNPILNQLTKRGMMMGNSLGVIGLTYGLVNGALVGVRHKDDSLNTLGAGESSSILRLLARLFELLHGI